MRFVCLGVGDAFSARWYSSSLAVEHDGRWLLVDCPHPIRKVLREAGAAAGVALDVGLFDAVLLTHLHADHASGLEDLLFYSRFVTGRKARVVAHPEVSGELWDLLRIGMERGVGPQGQPVPMTRDDYLDVIDLDESREIACGPFSIACRRTIHPVPTFAMRISAGGRTLGLSADTSFDPSLIDWLADADRIVHETNHGIHTPYEALAALPEAIRSRMYLIHYPDDFDTANSVIEALVPGRSYDV